MIKSNIDDPYFLEVLYYHVRLSLIKQNYNLHDLDGFNISGKYMGDDIYVDLGRIYNNILRSLNLALSIRAFMLNCKYIKYAFDDKLLFYNINTNYLTWDCHRVIMECIDDEDFSSIYHMIIRYMDVGEISEDQKEAFKENTVNPGYHHQLEFCKILADRADYNGATVIKNNRYLCSDIEQFVVNRRVEYIGNTAFAYCENLKEIVFEGKVLFGKFPIIECKNLQRIIVPTEYLDYYKEVLPYYKNIICDEEHKSEVKKIEVEPEEEPVKEEVEEEPTKEEVEIIDDLEIEHVYLDSTSADPYVEKEEEPKKPIDYSKLDEIFEKKATSYKYFWFFSIISLANERNQLKIKYKDIVIRMAAMAWPMVFEDEINLGKIDMMAKYLAAVEKSTKLIPAATSIVVENYLTQHYQSQGVERILSPLLKNVPYRFLSPWIKYTTDEDVIAESNRSDFTGLYALKDDCVLLNEDWWNHIQENYREICSKAMGSFEDYIKDNNSGMAILKLKCNGIAFIGKP